MNVKRRTRTGCLTCRTRRVKCDEKKPQCQRCENANVECAGYSMKQQLQVRYPRRNSTASTSALATANEHKELLQRGSSQTKINKSGYTGHRDDGLPLVALPVNPTPSQRPHSRAQDILGYHQYLYRTLSILFPPKNLHFWRDYMCEAAWETEWVLDAIVALGTIHRATLLCSQAGQDDQDCGQDAKLVALRTYIRALEGLSSNLAANGGPTPLALGVLVIMAYFECFCGNLAAAIRHTQIIQHYSYKLHLDGVHQVKTFVVPLESSLRDLELICRLSRPFPTALEPSSPSNAEKSVVAVPSSFFEAAATCSSTMLQRLLEFSAADLDLKHITWCVYTAHLNTVTREKIAAFLKALDEWKAINSSVFDNLANGHGLFDPTEYSEEALENLPFLPQCNENASLETCLALALYSFYKSRLLWALALSGDEDGSIELAAYFHVYDVLRLTKTAVMAAKKSSADIKLASERVRIGFTPLLYLVGRCCPKGSWVRWIVDELRMIGREGVFHSDAYATTLEVLLRLQEQEYRSASPVDDEKMFVPAHLRIIAVLIPDMDGQTFEAYYARPYGSQFIVERGYALLRTARWSRQINILQPLVEDCEIYQTPFCRQWLLERPIVQKWLDWNFDTEFNIDQVLRDHINEKLQYLGFGKKERLDFAQVTTAHVMPQPL